MLRQTAPPTPVRASYSGVIDLGVLTFVGLVLYGIYRVGEQWSAPFIAAPTLSLTSSSLVLYTFFSLMRGIVALTLSVLFTLTYGYVAARVARADRVMIPILDVLQSIPVLGFMPGLVLALVRLFPRTELGLELAAVLMIFTGQVWNMTFSFYYSLRSMPPELLEAADVYGIGRWRRLWLAEVPFATVGLVWNGMLSMAGGWFFLTVSEAFVLGGRDFRLPGVGSYMAVALDRNDHAAAARAVIAMTVMIIALDQLFWRPMVAWSQRFRFDESAAETEPPRSWLLDLLKRSAARARLVAWTERRALRATDTTEPVAPRLTKPVQPIGTGTVWTRRAMLFVAAVAGCYGLVRVGIFLDTLRGSQWREIAVAALLTLLRTTAAVVLGTLWAVPAGVMIGRSARLSRIMQPVIQVAASFPAPMLFPIVLAALTGAHVGLGFGAVLLMMLGTQWYVLFNVVAGTMSIPGDLMEAARVFRFGRLQQWRRLILPGIFPALVTGWLTAAGGAWNASIVAEYVHAAGTVRSTTGLGALISVAAERGDFTMLAASVIAMVALVMLLNRILWRPLQTLAARRYALAR